MASGASELKKDSLKDLHLETLTPAGRRAFLYLTKSSLLLKTKWYLAGGTGLAVQVGHRRSVDLDFFIPQASYDELGLERSLSATQEWKTTLRQRGTIYGELLGAKVSFIAYPFFVPAKSRAKTHDKPGPGSRI